MITDEELRTMPKVKPEHASRYLGGDPSAQFIRWWCQQTGGMQCPFGVALQMPGSRRYSYAINREALIQYKHGLTIRKEA